MTSSRTLSQSQIAALATRPGIGSDAALTKPKKPTAKQIAGPDLGNIYSGGYRAPAAKAKLDPGGSLSGSADAVGALRAAARMARQSDAEDRYVAVAAKKRVKAQTAQVRQDNSGKTMGRRRQRKSLAAGG